MNNAISKLNIYKTKFINRFRLRESDVLIASYPRSGNTWLRLLMADLILQANNYETGTDLPIHPDEIIPDLHVHNILKNNSTLIMPSRLIKTHYKQNKISKFKTIYLFRSPADVLCSYFHFHRRYKHLTDKTLDGIDRFCIDKADEWSSHTESYLNSVTNRDNDIFFISYEELYHNTAKSLQNIMSFYGLETNSRMCDTAVVNHEFSKKKKNEKLSENHSGEHFFRKGIINSHKDELHSNTISIINNKTEKTYKKALHVEMMQNNNN